MDVLEFFTNLDLDRYSSLGTLKGCDLFLKESFFTTNPCKSCLCTTAWFELNICVLYLPGHLWWDHDIITIIIQHNHNDLLQLLCSLGGHKWCLLQPPSNLLNNYPFLFLNTFKVRFIQLLVQIVIFSIAIAT